MSVFQHVLRVSTVWTARRSVSVRTVAAAITSAVFAPVLRAGSAHSATSVSDRCRSNENLSLQRVMVYQDPGIFLITGSCSSSLLLLLFFNFCSPNHLKQLELPFCWRYGIQLRLLFPLNWCCMLCQSEGLLQSQWIDTISLATSAG